MVAQICLTNKVNTTIFPVVESNVLPLSAVSRSENAMNRHHQTDDSLDGTQAGYFVIADISGYTGFLTNNELAHAHRILAELSNLLIEKSDQNPKALRLKKRLEHLLKIKDATK